MLEIEKYILVIKGCLNFKTAVMKQNKIINHKIIIINMAKM